MVLKWGCNLWVWCLWCITPQEHLCLLFSSEISRNMFFSSLSSLGEPLPTAASDFCSWLTGLKPDIVFWCCLPSINGFDARLGILRFSAHHSFKRAVNRSVSLNPVWPFSLMSNINKPWLSTEQPLTGWFLFGVLDIYWSVCMCVWENPRCSAV